MSRIVFEPIPPEPKHYCEKNVYVPSDPTDPLSTFVKREVPIGTIIECECGKRWIRIPDSTYGPGWKRDRWWRRRF